ncbi:MAG: DUF1295 domain-containing protein [Asgard group archaeon]|nr:DUF1295 domain-containing protein [Asgard group archaeon]
MFYGILLLVSLGIAVVVFILLFFVTAGYGRHTSKLWGPPINTHLGWFIMEIPTILVILVCFILSDKLTSIVHYVFLAVWFTHYTHRVFIYPFRIRNGKKITLTVVAMGFVFNLINAYIQGRWLFTFSDPLYSGSLMYPLSNANYSISWLYSPQFILGILIFIAGYFINKHSDSILRSLRKPDDTDNSYKIPYGGLYKRLSCPNYLGEILEWAGWAVLTWSLAGLYFALWTVANLFPRAISNHKWYKETFEDYPEERKAIIPFLI